MCTLNRWCWELVEGIWVFCSVLKGLFAQLDSYKEFVPSNIFFKQTTLMVTGGKLWWADEESAQLGTVTKRDGRNPVILRNKTSGVVHMKVYDREGQKGKQVRMYHTQTGTDTHTHTLMVSYILPLAWLCLTFRKKPVPDKQRRLLTALLPHFWEHPQLLLHCWLQPA